MNLINDMDTLSHPDKLETVKISPRYDVNHEGVFYVGVKPDGDEMKYTEPQRLADAIYLIGRGIDADNNYYRVIKWQDRISRQTCTDAIDSASIGTLQGWQYLQSKGLAILSSRHKRDLLSDYLQTQGGNAQWQVTTKAGWCGQAYILPSGEVLQPDDTVKTKESKVIFKGDKSQASYYQESGSLQEWQNHIGQYATDNSRLCLALGCAFAAPLMRLLGIEGGGFHLFGDSSDGKTTSAKVALSVWGKADDLRLGWRGTDLGFSNMANARNDGLLVLDEVGEANAKVVSMTAYSVLNGKGKVQGAKEGGNRAVNEWRVLVLSTGEQTLEAYLKASNTNLHAGQATRLPSIPADAGQGYGIFDVLHEFTDGAMLSEHLNMAANQYYGTVGRAFVIHLLADIDLAKSNAQKAMNDFLTLLPELSHQARRVGTRFALVTAALVLAQQYGLLHQTTVQIQTAIKQCFDAWLVREGTGKREDRRIIDQAIGWMQINAYSRFDDIRKDAVPNTIPNLAGYSEPESANSKRRLFYVIPDVFMNELGKGFDHNKVCEVLHAANGWLQKANGRWQKQKRVNGELQRFYVLAGIVPDGTDNGQED